MVPKLADTFGVIWITADQSREGFTAALSWQRQIKTCEQRSRRDQVLDCVFCALKNPNFEHLSFDLIPPNQGEFNLRNRKNV